MAAATPTSTPFPPAVISRAANAERLSFPDGSTMTLLADSHATGGKLSIHHTTLSPSAEGASPHHHTTVAEIFYVLRGTVQLLVGEDVIEAGPGDLAVVPPGMPHAFAAGPDTDAELLVAVTPGIERFDLFRRFEQIVTGRALRGSIVIDQSRYDTQSDVSDPWNQVRSTTTSASTNININTEGLS